MIFKKWTTLAVKSYIDRDIDADYLREFQPFNGRNHNFVEIIFIHRFISTPINKEQKLDVDLLKVCEEVDALLQDPEYEFNDPIYIGMISVNIKMNKL